MCIRDRSISSLESEKNSLSKNYELKYAELNDLKSIQIKNHFRQSQNLESIKELDDEIVQNNSDLDILKKKVDEYRPSIQKIDNLINEFSDRSKIIFSSAYDLANEYETNLTSLHILYVLLNNSEQYISDMLVSIASNIDCLKTDIFSLLNKNKKFGV